MLVDGNEMLASSRIQPCLLALCNLPPYYNDMIYLSLQLSFHGANSASTNLRQVSNKTLTFVSTYKTLS